MLEQKVKAAWRAFIAAKDPSADVSERAWEDLHFTERNAWFSAFRAFVVPTDDPQPVQEPVAELEAANAELLEALLTAYGHIDTQKLVISHYRDNSLIRAAIAKHGGAA